MCAAETPGFVYTDEAPTCGAGIFCGLVREK